MSTFTSVNDNHAVFFSKDGIILSYGRLDFFEMDGTTPKAVYSDITSSISLGTSLTLTNNGRTSVQAFTGTGVTMCRVYQYNGTGMGEELPGDPVWVLDNQFYLSGPIGATGSPSTIITVPTISALKNTAVGGTILLTGYYVEGDKPAIIYTWNNTSLVSDNGGNYIKSNLQAGGAWIYKPEGELDAVHFGVTLGTNDHMGRLMTWANELSYSGLSGVISSGIVRMNDNSGMTTLLSPQITMGSTVKWLNMGTGAAKVSFLHYHTKLLSENVFMHPSSVGQVWPVFQTKREQDVDLRWYGAQGGNAYQAMTKAIDGCRGINTLLITDTWNVTTPLGDATLPTLRCIGGGSLILDWTPTANTLKFRGVDEGHNGAIFDVQGNLTYDTVLTPVVNTSWLKETQLNFITANKIILDSNIRIYANIVIPFLYLNGGKIIRSSGTLTVDSLVGDGEFWESTTALSLKVRNQPYSPSWYILPATVGQVIADCTQSGLSGVIDCTNTGNLDFTGAVTANCNGRNLVIRNLTMTSGLRFVLTDCNQLEFDNCSISSSYSAGAFVTSPASKLEINNSRIVLPGYTSGSVYGRLTALNTGLALQGELIVTNSFIAASVLFQGYADSVNFSNCEFAGYSNLGSNREFLSNNVTYSTTSVYYHTSGPNKFSGGTSIQINGGYVKQGSLMIYGRLNPDTSLNNLNAVVNNVTFIAIGTSYPQAIFNTTLSNTIANVVSTGCTFLGSQSSPGSLIDTHQFATNGTAFLGATLQIHNNTHISLYYVNRASKGRYTDVRTVSGVDFVPGSEDWTFAGAVYDLTPNNMITVLGAFRNLRATAGVNVLLASDNSYLVGGVNVRSVNNTTGAITVSPYAWTEPKSIKPTITLDWTEYDV